MQAGSTCGVPGGGWAQFLVSRGGRFRLGASAEARGRADGARGVPLACAARVPLSHVVAVQLSGCNAVRHVPLGAKSTWRPSVATSLYLSALMLVPCVSLERAGLCSVLCVKPCSVAGLGARSSPRAFFVLLYFMPEK